MSEPDEEGAEARRVRRELVVHTIHPRQKKSEQAVRIIKDDDQAHKTSTDAVAATGWYANKPERTSSSLFARLLAFFFTLVLLTSPAAPASYSLFAAIFTPSSRITRLALSLTLLFAPLEVAVALVPVELLCAA
jgi:hypothetical protein